MKKLILIFASLAIGGTAMAMEPGVYEKKQRDGSTDILTIRADQSMFLEESRQVGGAGGISDEETVPYETVCRYRQVAKITSEDASSITFLVSSINLTKRTIVNFAPKQLENDTNCNTYVNIFNGHAQINGISFTIDKEGFRRQ